MTDIKFLLNCLDYMFEYTGENLDPEDMAIINRIRKESEERHPKISYDAIGTRVDLLDQIYNADPTDTPIMKKSAKGE